MSRLYYDELCHYGRKGMKWGQHIYGDRSYASKNAKYVNDIYKTLTTDEKRKVMGIDSGKTPPKQFTTQKEYEQAAASFILKYKNVPVSAFDIWSEADERGNHSNEVAVSIITRSGPEYRNKGYASDAIKRGMKWIENNKSIDTVWWDVLVDNTASRKLAEKHGFKPTGVLNNGWTSYKKTYDRGKSK